MRSAPPIRLGAGIDRPWRRLLAACAVAATVLMGTWAWSFIRSPLTDPAGRWIAALAVLGVAGYGAWLVRRAQRRSPVDLAWDGRSWTLAARPRDPSGTRVPCRVQIELDAGRWLLLRLRPLATGAALGTRTLHCALHAACHDAAAWHALRCALHAPGAQGEPVAPHEAGAHER
jgi:hypothetical protein